MITGAVVTFVVIGRNEEKNLGRCLESVRRQSADARILYVDSRSTDRSVEIAKGCAGVEVLVLTDERPSAAKARNAGWRAARGATFVHFVDGDCVLADGWLPHALAAARDPSVGAVFGRFKEMHPDASIYNRMADLDWPTATGPVETFGGIVLVRRACLEATTGYDETLRVGEDPALALDIRRQGLTVLQTPHLMAHHDIDIASFGAYWRRNVMVGWSLAEISYRSRGHAISAWSGRTLRLSALLASALVVAMVALLITPWAIAGAILLCGVDLLRIARNNVRRAGSWAHAIAYALHARVILLPMVIGHWKWYRERQRA